MYQRYLNLFLIALKESEVATMIKKILKSEWSPKKLLKLSKICTYDNFKWIKCFDGFYLHQNCIEEQTFYEGNFNQSWIKGQTEFLRQYFKYFAGAHEKKNYHKTREVWLSSKISIIGH